MTAENISDAMYWLDEDLIEEADRIRRKQRRAAGWWKRRLIAACICITTAAVTCDTLARFDYSFGHEGGCGGGHGVLVDGTNYYAVPHSGVWSYVPGGEPKKELSTYWMEDWTVNEYGIYYRQGRSLYVKPHENGKREKLYTASWPDYTDITFSLCEDGSVAVTSYHRRTRINSEVRLDGKSGEVLEVLLEPTHAGYYTIHPSVANKTLGERSFELVVVDDRDVFMLTENGKIMLPEEWRVYRYSAKYRGDTLWYHVWRPDQVDGEWTWVVLWPDGRNEIVTTPDYYVDGSNDYLFYQKNLDAIWCFEIETGEIWQLNCSEELEVHDLVSDGAYLYTSTPWGDGHDCWKVEYAEGKPAALTLIRDDIGA